MDNLCHTLVGAAFGQAGLKQRTRFGNATLMIAANIPDVDVLVFATSTPAVAFRRGWTHGVLAQALLPIALTAGMLLIARYRVRTRQANDDDPPARAGWLLLLAYIGVISHVLLDLLNTYGVRLLPPLDWRWFYGDAVFILDPWLWLTLGLGVWLSSRRTVRAPAPARTALVVATLYIAAMCVTARVASGRVLDEWNVAHPQPPRALMVGPIPVNAFRRQIIVDSGDHYETGTFAFPARVVLDPEVIPKNDRDPRVTLAREAPRIQAFLVWSRFPFWTLEPAPGGTRVTVGDARFGGRGAGFQQSVVVP